MELLNSDLFSQIVFFGLSSLLYLVACLILPWVPIARTILTFFHSFTTRLMFPGLTLVSVFTSTVFVTAGMFAFFAYVEVTDPQPYIFIPTTLFVLGLGGVFSINMIAEVTVFKARKSGVMPKFGDGDGFGSPMSLIGMSTKSDSFGEPTYKRAPILRALRTRDDETLLPKLRPFVPIGWI